MGLAALEVSTLSRAPGSGRNGKISPELEKPRRPAPRRLARRLVVHGGRDGRRDPADARGGGGGASPAPDEARAAPAQIRGG